MSTSPPDGRPAGVLARLLQWVEWVGNKLPDPALLFVWALLITWVVSALLAPVRFSERDPRSVVEENKRLAPPRQQDGKAQGHKTGELSTPAELAATTVGLFAAPAGAGPLTALHATAPRKVQTIEVRSQLTGNALLTFLEDMVETFTGFHPLGVVLVAMLGVGVAEHTGFINACLKAMLGVTPQSLLTPMLLVVAIVSHTAGDTGYVLVIPLGGVIFAAAGRHPVAGIVCAFAGVSGGFSANFIVSALDPLLQGFTETAAQIVDPTRTVNPLCNYIFMASSSVLIVLVGWYLTDRVIEPRLGKYTPPDPGPVGERPPHPPLTTSPGDADAERITGSAPAPEPGEPSTHVQPADGTANTQDMSVMGRLSRAEIRGMSAGLAVLLVGLGLLLAVAVYAPQTQPRLIQSIVPLIFFLFLIPGVVYGYTAGTVKNHRDVVQGMSKSMSAMGYYLVLAFCAAQFIYAFRESNLGILLAVKGADWIQWLGLPAAVTIVAVILLTATVNLLIGSASAKWALVSPIFVPMLMQLGLSPELTQAAYRVGDSSTNIITPLMPYFPLVVVYCQRYTQQTGIGTLISLMLPYSISFLTIWTVWLLVFWALGLPLGIPMDVGYTYP